MYNNCNCCCFQKRRCHQFSQSRGTDLKPLTFYFTLPAKSCLFPPVKESWTPSFFSPPPVHFPSEPPPLLLPFSSSVDTTEFARNPENVLNACTNHELIRNWPSWEHIWASGRTSPPPGSCRWAGPPACARPAPGARPASGWGRSSGWSSCWTWGRRWRGPWPGAPPPSWCSPHRTGRDRAPPLGICVLLSLAFKTRPISSLNPAFKIGIFFFCIYRTAPKPENGWSHTVPVLEVLAMLSQLHYIYQTNPSADVI